MTTDVEVTPVTPVTKAVEIPAAPKTLEEALALISDLSKHSTELDDKVRTIRKYEKEAKQRAEAEAAKSAEALKEQGKYKDLYEAALSEKSSLLKHLVDQKIDAALSNIIDVEGFKNKSTIMKLVDKSKIKVDGDTVEANSIKVLIDDLKKTDPILFTELKVESKPTIPTAARASEDGKVVKDLSPLEGIEQALQKMGK